MKKTLAFRAVAVATLAQFLAISCGGQPKPPPAGPGGGTTVAQPGAQPLVQVDTGAKGLVLRLSDGTQGAPAADRSKLPPATSLGDAEVAALLARLAPVAVSADDVKAFALRDRSTPPPRTGRTIRDAFPGPGTASRPPVAADAGKPLEVVRFAPEGDVPLAPMLQVTFSQPMVAVTSQDDAAAVVPVTMTPTPPGRWRWLGTKTLVFDPQVRFPQATTYKVVVPAGTTSANGNVLAAAKTFTFTTPSPRVVSSWPGRGPQRLDAPMFVLFDQKVDAAAVLATTKVTAAGTIYGTRALTADEIEQHETLKALVDGAEKNEHDGRWIAFRADTAFPKATKVTVAIGPRTPSLEGPNPTRDTQTFTFETYAPLRIERAECGYRECPPGAPFSIRFNNPLDTARWNDASVTLTPDVPRAKIVQAGNYLTLQAATKAQTTYRARIAAGIVDEFGQTLGKDAELEWKVGKALPNLFGPSGMVALDPGAKAPTLDVFTTSYDALKVQLWEVKPTDWDAFGYYMQRQWERKKPKLPGKKVMDELVRITGNPNELVETKVELTRALGRGGFGHVIAVVEPSPWKERYEPPRLITWVQSTRIGLDAAIDATDMKAWVNRLSDGAPLGGVELTLLPWGTAAKSDDTGMATLALSPVAKKGANLLVAKHGDDVAFLPDDHGWYGEYGQWQKQNRDDGITWHITDDRQMYKPGEEVRLKGWLRVFQSRKGGDIAGVAGRVSAVKYRVVDPVGNELLKGSMRVSALGGFDTRFTLPKTPNLGYATVYLETEGSLKANGHHGFQIQEFRTPEYEVSAAASQGPHMIGASADVTVKASYFAGGGLQGAAVNWYVTAQETTYTPPDREDWTFGVWVPWWGWRRGWWEDDGGAYVAPKTWSHAAKTDATGAHVLHVDFVSANPPVPMSVAANATVTDVNRQQWTANATLLVHPSSLYVGLKTEKPFVEKGQPIDVAAIAVDLDGKAVAGRVLDISSVRLDWDYEQGTYVQKELDPQSCAPASAVDAVTCEFATREGGQYRIRALVADDAGRANKTELTVWVTGGDTPPAREVQQEIAQLIPDRKEYKHGDTAEILVQTPFYPAEGILSVRRSGLLSSERFTMKGPTQTVRVPIVDSHTPNVYVQVDLIGAAARVDDNGNVDASLPKRPAYATGQLNLPVPPKARTLAVEVTPRAKKVGPGEAARFEVVVKDAAGRPVPGAEVALVVVDEAVLSLTGFQFANPISSFYGMRGADARDHHLRGFVRLAQPDAGKLAIDNHADRDGDAIADEDDSGLEVRNGWADTTTSVTRKNEAKEQVFRGKGRVALLREAETAGAVGGQAPPPIAVRTNFNPLAAFAPEVKTGADGRAAVEVKMPDNLTRYRVVALVAAGEKSFGKGESAITARLPLMVRPSAPRFLNFGDTFELPVVVQNQTDAAMEVKVAVRATNARITKGAGRVVKVPANDRVEVRFPAAAELPGTARFQLAASAGTGASAVSDAAEVALPVWTPATTEAFATYGQIDGGASAAIRQPVSLPGKVVTAFGGVEVETSATQLQALTDAFLYLVSYPFECSEQRSSRVAGIAALRDVLGAFKAKDLPSKAALEAQVAEDLERLFAVQNHDGGFPFWQRGHESWPYLTVHITNAMVRAKRKGFTVEKAALDNALQYLKTIERRYPHYYPEEVKRTITSYALYTRMLAGDRDVARAKGLVKEAGGVDKLSMEAVGWLLGVVAGQADATVERAAILRHLDNKVTETAAAANFTTGYRDGGHLLLASDRRVDAIVLESLIAEKRTSDLIPKLVVGLLAHKKAGKWANTQENVFVLFALDLYFHEYEKVTPDFVARVWLGDGYAGEHAFKGRTTERHAIDIPMAEIAKRAATAPADLVVQKDGAGRLYYRIGMTYAPADLKLAPADHGFTVVRTYEPIDDAKDVVRDADGTWRIKAGARVRVRLSMVAEHRRYHVALVDPLPAGFEAMNPALATTGPIPQDPAAQTSGGAYWWWSRTWYEHQNLRDERVEAFASLLWDGVHEYTYVARATTPGSFVVPPSKAEEMYAPETFGRSATDRVLVE